MFDSPVFESIDLLYSAIDEHRECNEEIIIILVSLHCYINKPFGETVIQRIDRLKKTDEIIRTRVQDIVNIGLEEAQNKW